MKGVKLSHLEAIVDFVYNREENVAQDDLKALLEIAKDLKVKGLSESTNNLCGVGQIDDAVEETIKDPDVSMLVEGKVLYQNT